MAAAEGRHLARGTAAFAARTCFSQAAPAPPSPCPPDAPPPVHTFFDFCSISLLLLLQLRCPTWGKPSSQTASSRPTPRGRAAPQPSTLVRAPGRCGSNGPLWERAAEAPGPLPPAPRSAAPFCVSTALPASQRAPSLPHPSHASYHRVSTQHPPFPLACRRLRQLHRLLVH